MTRTVLIIDDDDVLRNTLAHGLRGEGFHAVLASSAQQGDKILSRITVDAIILDRMMTDTDGLTFLRSIRQSGNKTPVIMLTAMGGAENAIAGLSGGADDYLAKPFQMRELVLRLNNIISRQNTTDTKLPAGMIFTDDEFFVLSSDNGTPRLLALSGEEKKLLQSLISPMGNIVPAAPMVAKRLRGKLNLVLSHLDIITIRGRGYKLLDTSTTHATK